MRVKDVFSVFPRRLRPGKVVFYYQCYDENGNRSSGLSTGQVTKTAARVFFMRLYREGNLFPHKRCIPTFGEYAAPWWDWDTCDYLKNQKGRKDIIQAYRIRLPAYQDQRKAEHTPGPDDYQRASATCR